MNKLTWPAVGLIGVIGAVIVALAALTDWGSGEILAAAGILLGTGSGAAIAGTVAGRVDQVHAETTAQTETINTIERRTNGELDARIESGMQRAAELVLGELREQGVIR